MIANTKGITKKLKQYGINLQAIYEIGRYIKLEQDEM